MGRHYGVERSMKENDVSTTETQFMRRLNLYGSD